MTLLSRPLLIVLFGALIGVTGAPARAAEAASPAPAQPNSSLPDSVRRVEQQTGGEVLRAEPMQQDGREVYRIKVLTSDGRVRVMQDDPHKGVVAPPPAQPQDKPAK